MSISSNDNEDVIILYHDVVHLIAMLDMISEPALNALIERLMQASARDTGNDRWALATMATIAGLYREDKTFAVAAKWLAEGHNPFAVPKED